MKLVKSDTKKWLEKTGYSKKVYLDENDLNTKGVFVQKNRIKSGETAKSHFHKKQTEIFYFLNNNGYFIVNDKRVDTQEDDILVIKPFDKHTVVNDTTKDFLYLAFKLNYEEDDLFWD